MPDPISRVELAQRELDRVFGENYALNHPQVLAATVQSASLDYAAHLLAVAIGDIAHALVVDDGDNGSMVDHGLVRAPAKGVYS
jgi:hypothetical protein